ncbi:MULTISPECIES: TolC family protein [unclassified Arcicella]|uniref:TolC family protein n=1 Tax=unclassified Arcicella TaxID=2644986 RepID=UPI00285B3DCC|nr:MULTISPECIES: TolC family protein [unclassified Arcicella]MDR6563240.1 outer membrane protein TolC [Arcicella sp. BE51]MDR6811609.1 outer membrane protein TolC [Arcicella sp. BE140]MDR6823135.1 outer membrane protein TolC [Arcicella sp. BE139]
MKIKYNYIISLLLLADLFVGQEVLAQDKTDESLKQLVRAAIEYAPKIKEQQQMITIGDYRTKIQESALKPQIQSEIGVTRIDPVAKASFAFGSATTNLQFQPNMNYNANIGANYVLYDWGKQNINIEKSKLETELSRTGVEGLKNIYAYQVANLYYGIVYTQKAIEVQKEQLKLVDDNGKIISDRLKQGDALDYDQVSIQVRYKNAETRLSDLQSQLERQYIYLSSLIGKDAHGTISPNADFNLGLTALSVEEALNQAQTSNTDLKTLKDRDLIAEREVKIAKMGSAPYIAANASLGLKNGYLPRINGEVPPISEDFKFGSTVGLKLTIPVYSGNKTAHQTEVARLNREMLKYTAEVTNQNLKRDLEAAQNDYNAAKNKLDLSERNVFQAQYALKLANARFKNGVITNVEIEASQTALRESQLTQLQYQYQMAIAQLELNRLTGIKFW